MHGLSYKFGPRDSVCICLDADFRVLIFVARVCAAVGWGIGGDVGDQAVVGMEHPAEAMEHI